MAQQGQSGREDRQQDQSEDELADDPGAADNRAM